MGWLSQNIAGKINCYLLGSSLQQCTLLLLRISEPELLDSSWGTPNAHRSHSISDISSFSTVSVLSFYTIHVRALCVKEPQLRRISSVRTVQHDNHMLCQLNLGPVVLEALSQLRAQYHN